MVYAIKTQRTPKRVVVYLNNSEYAVQGGELVVEYPQLRNIRKNIAMATASFVRLCTSYESEVL